MSLRDHFQGPLTAHELINLIVHLPPGCPLDRAQRGEAADWVTVDSYILAQIANILLQANSSKRVPDSHLIHPPGSRQRRPKAEVNGHQVLGAAELDALFTGGG